MDKRNDGLAGRRVLVIEDEWLVSTYLEDILGDLGCEVAGSASRFSEAADKANSLSFDIAVLDVNLNGKYTFPIAEALLRRGTPFVFSTGYGAGSLPAQFHAVPLLQKPFQRSHLETALRAALAIGGGRER